MKELQSFLMGKYQWTINQIDELPFFETLDLIQEENKDPEEEVVFIDQLGF